jgi:heterotetrameric sarcosine oxidase gamma subunit
MLDATGFVAQPVRRSPLEHRQPISSGDGEATLAERKFIGKLIVRGDAMQIGPLMESATSIVLPAEPCTSSVAGERIALWLGPSEWMLLTPESEERTISAAIETALAGQHHQITDVTDYYTVIRVGGAKARKMLMKLTTLDMHPSKFPEGAVKGSIFGRVPAVLHCPAGARAEPSDFDLIIRRSHADYLWCLLALAAREYGLPEQTPEGRVKLAMPG